MVQGEISNQLLAKRRIDEQSIRLPSIFDASGGLGEGVQSVRSSG